MNPILTRFKRRPLEIYDRKICLESNDLPNPAMCPFHLLDILGDVSKESQKSVSWRSYNLISILWIWDLIKIQKEYKILQIKDEKCFQEEKNNYKKKISCGEFKKIYKKQEIPLSVHEGFQESIF